MPLASCGPRLGELAPALRVDVPLTCENLLEQITPPVFGPEDDAIEAFLRLEAIMIEQNGTIELARECLRRQRLEYAGKGRS